MQISHFLQPINRPATKYRIAQNIAYGSHPAMQLDIYTPLGHPPKIKLPVVVFWHGGSWNGGTKDSYAYMGKAIAKMNCIAVIVGYRKYPEITFPTFIYDGAEALQWINENIARYGGDSLRLFIMGHSAGAHTAAMLTYYPQYTAAIPNLSIRGFIGVSGPYDFYPRRDLQPIFPIDDPQQPWRIGPHLKKTRVPALLLHGYLDPIVRTKYSRALARQLQKAGAKVTAKYYLGFEHFLIVVSYGPLLRLFLGPWRETRRFIAANQSK